MAYADGHVQAAQHREVSNPLAHLQYLQPVCERVVVADSRPAGTQPVARRQQRAKVLLNLRR